MLSQQQLLRNGISRLKKTKEVGLQETNDERATQTSCCDSQNTFVDFNFQGFLLAFGNNGLGSKGGYLENHWSGNFAGSFVGLWLARARIVPIVNIYNGRSDEVASGVKTRP